MHIDVFKHYKCNAGDREVLADTAKRILRLPTRDLKRAFTHALLGSIAMDPSHDPPRPLSPEDIANRHAVDVETQVEYGISLTKDLAVEFLRSYGMTMSRYKFRRYYTADRYMQFFERKVSRIGYKAMVFTYAEILHWVGYGPQLSLPEELELFAKR